MVQSPVAGLVKILGSNLSTTNSLFAVKAITTSCITPRLQATAALIVKVIAVAPVLRIKISFPVF
jgi:hypothetical protein